MEMSRIVRESATLVAPPADARLAVSRDPDLQAYIEALPIAAAIVSFEGHIAQFFTGNRAFWSITQHLPDPEDLRTLREAAADFAAVDAASEQFSWREPGLGGRHFQVHLAPIASRSHPGPLKMLSMIDCTAAIETERSLRSEMVLDSLTGLPNRVAFEEAVETVVERQPDATVAVLIVNLKRFSRVNESIGTLAGDELIITVARRMVGAMRAGDMIARLGADEFGVLVHLVDGPGDALHVARRMQTAIGAPLRLTQIELRIECAIGCAHWHESLISAEELIRHGQVALKQAKTSSRVEIYEAGNITHARHRLSMETELRHAIENGEMRFDFQPLVTLRSGRVAGFEALARWSHPTRGEIQPADFIPVAEESGLIMPLGHLAIDTALRTLAEWDRIAGEPLPVYISVNVSPVQLVRESVAIVVADALARHNIDGGRLTLEVTESSIIADPDRAARLLGDLKALNCRIAMDDFGTGYSSLASLHKLPIDVLKIDRQFVSAMQDDRDSTAIVRAILGMASALGMATIAEGIEDQSAANLLDVLGCDIGQGFWFSRAIRSEAAFEYLTGPTRKRAAA